MHRQSAQLAFAAVLLALFALLVALLTGTIYHQNIRYIDFTDAQDGGPEPWVVTTRGLTFPVAVFKSRRRVVLPIEVGHFGRENELWVQIGEADNHSRAILIADGVVIGQLDNIIDEELPMPRLVWKHFGTLPEGAQRLEIELFTEENRTFYAELATVALTTSGADAGDFRIASGNRRADMVAAILLLLLALIVFSAISRGILRPAVHRPKHLFALFLCACLAASGIFFVFGGVQTETAITAVDSGALSEASNNRYRLEHAYTENVNDALLALRPWIRAVFDNRAEYDATSIEFASHTSGYLTSEVYYLDDRINSEPPFSSRILSGGLQFLQRAPQQVFVFLMLPPALLFFVSLLGAGLTRNRWPAFLGLAAVSNASILCSLHLSIGWDELYINLRHSYFLLEQGMFSFNGGHYGEGTVDLVPMVLTAVLGRLGVELTDALLMVTLSGNILMTVAAFLIAERLTGDRVWALLTAALIGLLPNVLWVGGTGFTATFFTGWALLGAHFLVFTERKYLGLFLLATLTLVRVEGIMFALLVGGFVYGLLPLGAVIRRRGWRDYLVNGAVKFAVLSLPFVVSLLARAVVYGSPIPNPVLYKNSHFDEDYILNGLQQFSEMVFMYDVHLIGLLFVILLIGGRLLGARLHHGLILLPAALLLFILPYYLSGGDWFTSYWTRYALPFIAGIVLFTLVAMRTVGAAVADGKRGMFAAWAIAGLILFPYQMSAAARPGNAWTYAYGLFDPHFEDTSNWWGRINLLYATGRFLRQYTPRDALIASPEVATVMYFAEREMVGLLGVANPIIARMPLQPLSPGDLLHRRRGHYSIYEDRPDVIALWEPVMELSSEQGPMTLDRMRDYSAEIFFDQMKVDIAYFRVGSFASLENLGYRHLFIAGHDIVLSLFVHETLFSAVVENLTADTYQWLGSIDTNYAVSQRLSDIFLPAHPDLLGGRE